MRIEGGQCDSLFLRRRPAEAKLLQNQELLRRRKRDEEEEDEAGEEALQKSTTTLKPSDYTKTLCLQQNLVTQQVIKKPSDNAKYEQDKENEDTNLSKAYCKGDNVNAS